MAVTAQTLVQELSSRLGEFASFTATGVGTTTSIVSTDLTRYFPEDTKNLNAWLFAAGGTVGNVGHEARAASWLVGSAKLALHAPGFPAATAQGDTFELHRRTPRSRKLAAINDAVGQLGLAWPREVIDETLTTAVGTWQYVLPASQNWERVWKVEVQVNMSQPTYPYTDARPWGWRARKAVDGVTGQEVWVIQFVTLPPINRKIRIFGDAWFGALAADADVLPLSGRWQGMALSWIYDWAKFRLLEEQADKMPAGDSEKSRQRAQDKLVETRDFLIRNRRTLGSGKINVPGDGSGTFDISPQDRWKYLGVFGNTH